MDGRGFQLISDKGITIEICGSSGDGALATGEIFTKTLSDMGFHTLSFDSYPAEIRGFGKSVAHIRAGAGPLTSLSRKVDILVALNDRYSIEQIPKLVDEGVVIFDNKPIEVAREDNDMSHRLGPGVYSGEKDEWVIESDGSHCIAGYLGPGMYLYGVPLNQLSQRTTGESRSRNIVILGVMAALFGLPDKEFINNLTAKLGKKGKSIDTIISAFRAGYAYVNEQIVKLDPYLFRKEALEKRDYRLMTGNKAVATAAIDSECKFYAGYPITPATKIMEILSAELPKHGGHVVQTEDEIAAIGFVTGASFAGVRAMTATSGPGFCLMTEFIGYNVMAENPIVIVDAQRAGPATGLPTKTEQSDLNHALFAGNGDAPRIVLAPTNVSECYQWTAEAFYLAEKYQMPVIMLTDLFLSLCLENVLIEPIPDYKKHANKYPTEEELKVYLRQKVTDDGVSPRTIPGQEGGCHVVSGLEQDQYGTPVYDATTHTMMTEKRFRKIKTALEHDIPLPERSGAKGKVKLGIISWGSTTGAVREAVNNAVNDGKSVAMLKLIVVAPLHTEPVRQFLDSCDMVLVPELNFEGQFANWLSMHFNYTFHRLNRVTVSPITYNDIEEEIDRLLKG